MEGKEKPPSIPAISNQVLEEKSLLDIDDVLRHIGAQSAVYLKMLFTLLAPCAANCMGYCWRIAECVRTNKCVGRG